MMVPWDVIYRRQIVRWDRGQFTPLKQQPPVWIQAVSFKPAWLSPHLNFADRDLCLPVFFCNPLSLRSEHKISILDLNLVRLLDPHVAFDMRSRNARTQHASTSKDGAATQDQCCFSLLVRTEVGCRYHQNTYIIAIMGPGVNSVSAKDT